MSTVSEIKQKVDIVEVISESVALQKAGRNFKALCPFHSEKHASFFVFPDQQRWHCFGACGTGGDVFSFLMKKDGISFSEALQLLAERSGTQLPSKDGRVQTGKDRDRERLVEINEAATQYYEHVLKATRSAGAARSYLSHRGITSETSEAFRLGFAPDSWEALKRYLGAKGYTEEELLQAGLLAKSDRDSTYDRFRNRLMFPIFDPAGRVLGFGARTLADATPKYVNSPQTALFDKSSILYGAHKAREGIRRRGSVIIVEGYFDVLRAHQHGYQNVVGSMGTSLTERQVESLKRLTRNIALALDSDTAGESATLRSAQTLGQALDREVVPVPTWSGLIRYENTLDAEIRVIALPSGKDPDELIGENPSLWEQLVEEAQPMLDFALQTVVTRTNLNTARGKRDAIERLAPLLGDIEEPIKKSHYVHKLARVLGVSDADVRASCARALKSARTTLGKPSGQAESPAVEACALEDYCLALLLQHPGLRESAGELSPEHFDSTENREIFNEWLSSTNPSDLKHRLDASLEEHLDYLLSKSFPPGVREKEELRQRTLSDCILRLQERLSKRSQVRMETLLNLAREERGVDAEITTLEEHGLEASRQLHQIFLKREQKSRPKRDCHG